VSFLTKLRTVIHTTPVLRQVSQGFANTFGLGKAYSEFDQKIGIGADGEPVPSQDQYQGFGRDDLAAMAAERYPNTAALLTNYRQYQAITPRAQPLLRAQPIEYVEPDLDYYYADDYPEDDYGDEE